MIFDFLKKTVETTKETIFGIKASYRTDPNSGYYTEGTLVQYPNETITTLSCKSLWETFDEVLEKDGKIAAKLFSRRAAVLGVPWTLSGNGPQYQFVNDLLSSDKFAPNLYKLIDGLLHAVSHGFAFIEPLWEKNEEGWIVPKGFILVPWRRIRFDQDYNPLLQTKSNTVTGEQIPMYKGLVARSNPENGPYGHGLLYKLYWLHLLKKNNIKYWCLYNEKFGTPTAVGKYKGNPSSEQLDNYMAVLQGIQQDASIVCPESLAVELLEATRASSSDYDAFLRWLGEEIVQTILGQTLTSETGGTGSYAQAKAHNEVRWDFIKSDALLIQPVIQRWINWIIELNWGTDANSPVFAFDLREPSDDAVNAQVLNILVSAGLKIPSKWAYEKFQIPEPVEGETILEQKQLVQQQPQSQQFQFSEESEFLKKSDKKVSSVQKILDKLTEQSVKEIEDELKRVGEVEEDKQEVI